MSRTAITIRKVDGVPGKVYYPLEKVAYDDVAPDDQEIIVSLSAAALNHRDYFIRQHLYPGTTFGVPLLSDGCGIVSSAGSSPDAQKRLRQRVILCPGIGWESDPEGPEHPAGYRYIGGTKLYPKGTLAETIRVNWQDVEEVPEHLSDVEAAALPLTGLTAWRALFTKSGAAAPGRNILVTGIGGGVALMVLLFASAIGANVYVTSGSDEKLEKAKLLGARGGVNYKTKGWEMTLLELLPSGRRHFDAIIDGAGGEIVASGVKLLKSGGVIVSYGMTMGPKMFYSMNAVLKNIEIRGTTGGSRKEFASMVRFVDDHQIRPVVSRVVDNGLNALKELDGLFDDIGKGSQFGKLVVKIDGPTGQHGGAQGHQRQHKLEDSF
ncbi:hypothetical protein CLAIMM_11496 [Cladophialophora immunda]|nr:hypothetical protein CLAIMM_11496 [Cladophialophora immunda]